jgi:serine/threonine protein kinase
MPFMMETVPSGTVLNGHYRIERALGSGGFGHVYLAIDLKTNQQYAIKEYLVTGASGQAQLQHEARVLSQLHHPNLPAFHEAFNERGRYYVVLSYIEGNDLTDLIRIARQRNEPIPLTRIMGWILSICDAVRFLHSQQPPVIHRDLKPDNIRIMPNGTALLVDLGNAKAAAGGERTLFFIRHQGTPGYAPQEQYPGGAGTDARSDVYALGATLYFALTAHEPPSVSARNQSIQQGQTDLPSLQEQLAKNPPENSDEANAARQFRLGVTKPTKPAPRHIRHLAQLGTLPPELLDQLNRIIKRAMAMKPKERYQSVAEFSNDLKQVAAALPASVPPAGPSRLVDPHTTQPDLPLLYDAMQAAKENVGQGQTPADAGRSQTPPQQTPPPATQASSNTCQRCGAPLLPQASFCPRCGTSITPDKGSTSTPPQTPGSTTNQAPPKNNPQGHNISTEQAMRIALPHTRATGQDSTAEQTMRITPKVQMQQPPVQIFPPKPPLAVPSGPASPTTQTPSQNGTPLPGNRPAQNAAPSLTPVPSRPFPQNTSFQSLQRGSSQASPATQTNKPPSVAPLNKRNSKIILAIVAALVVLLLVLLLALALRAGGRLHSSIQRYSIEAQEVHERNVSFSVIASTTPAHTGVWTCRPAFHSAPRIT